MTYFLNPCHILKKDRLKNPTQFGYVRVMRGIPISSQNLAIISSDNKAHIQNMQIAILNALSIKDRAQKIINFDAQV